MSMVQNKLLFASEIKSLLCDPTVARQIDLTALHHYLSLNYTPAPFTLFAGIRQLLPGHFLLIEADGRSREEAYWDITYANKCRGNERELVDQFEAALMAAVKRRMVSDVPVGAFLSGGVDSSAIVYWMAQQRQESVRTFAVGFREASYNEAAYARIVAASCRAQSS